ncbi:MAG: PmoA family protein [Planctomycetes bacterium]|nr:PmoA family protein [Planctomycetota bacterium]
MRSSRIVSSFAVVAVAAALVGSCRVAAAAEAKGAFMLVPDDLGKVLKTPDGRIVFRYMTKKPEKSELTANSVCCLFPVNTPSGERAVDFAPPDHRHHRGVFLAWHAVEGRKPADFWGWGEFAPTAGRVIENRSVDLVRAGARGARIAVRNAWTADGETMIDEETTIGAREVPEAFVIDLDFRLTAKAETTLEQTAFGGFCVKARKDGKAVYTDPKGEVKLPAPHHLKPETDWPSADWYDYTIALESGKTIGIAILDHPKNPPARWHNLAAIAMLNPCIVAPGPVVLKAGEPLRLRYRLVVHDGPAPADLLKEVTAEWRARS